MKIKVNCAHTRMVKLEELVENPRNNNKHSDAQIDQLIKVLKFQGMRNAIVVSKRSGFITKGHLRLMALKKMGVEEAPIDEQDYDSEAMEYADLTADNTLARQSVILYENINKDLKELEFNLDLDLLGIQNFKAEKIEELPSLDDDDSPKKIQITFTGSQEEINFITDSIDDLKEDFKGQENWKTKAIISLLKNEC